MFFYLQHRKNRVITRGSLFRDTIITKHIVLKKIGAHVSISGGYTKALERITAIGGNCLQIFSTSPRGWKLAELSNNEIEEFIRLKEELAIDSVYFHASYLINLADDGRIGYLSKESLISELNLASRLGIRGSIIHLGSFKDSGDEPIFKHEKYGILITNIREVLESISRSTSFIIENAGMRKIGKSIEEIEQIIKDVGNGQLRVCLDTCHLHTAGHDISTEKKLDSFLDDFDRRIGLSKLEVWHMNDSRDLFGSFRDRHENIGEGEIGLATFRLLLNHPKIKHLPFILETPGFDQQGPDKQNIEILKSLVEN